VAAFALGLCVSVPVGAVMKKHYGRQIDRARLRAALAGALYTRDAGETTPMAIGRRLAHARGCARVSQHAMARHLGIGHSTWQTYEEGDGTPTGRALIGLLELGINPTWVLTGTGSTLVDGSSEDSSQAQANGRGSAGECPAPSGAKTPAAGAECFRVAGVGAWNDDGTLSLFVNLQRPGGGVE